VKKLMICIIVLIGFIGLAVYSGLWIMGINQKASVGVRNAVEAFENGNMTKAGELLERTYNEWVPHLDTQEALIHHEGLCFAEESFQMALVEVKENREAFLTEAARLLTLLDNLAWEDIPSFGNLF